MTAVPSLFARTPLVRSWLPDETLFSFASRFHRIAGNARSATTCLQLFGHARQGAAHDFPCRLDQLCERFEGWLGAAHEIATERTLLRYYWRFIDQVQRDAAIKAMRGPGIGGLKFSLGLITSRFRANHPLKACPRCMQEDRKKFYCAYWHLEAQFPCVWVCREHGEVLRSCNVKSTGVHRFGWTMPDEGAFHPLPSALPLDSLVQLAKVVDRLISYPANFDRARAARAYTTALLRRGFRRRSGRVDIDAAAIDLAKFATPLTVLDELRALPTTATAAKNTLYRALSTQRALTHPIWHTILIAWLFGPSGSWPWEDAEAVPPSATLDASAAPVQGHGHGHGLDKRTKSVLITAPSARSAASQLGIDVTTAMAWAAAIGVAFKRRPKLLCGNVELRLLADLRAGADKQHAAAVSKVSVQAITRYLRTVPGLHEQWIRARFDTAQRSARERWTSLLDYGSSGVGVTKLRALDPAAYAWLYRHDAAWLADQSRWCQLKSGDSRIRRRVDWDERDQILAQDVERVGLQLFECGRPVKLWQIYQQLPSLKAKLASLDRLPLTRSALLQVTQHRGKSDDDFPLLRAETRTPKKRGS